MVSDLYLCCCLQVTIVEPGAFATSAAKGAIQWAPALPAYDRPELPAAAFRAIWAGIVPPGDPKKGMETVYKLAALEQPPLHFQLGKDAVGAARAKTSAFLADTDKYESWSEGLVRDA